MIYSSLFYLFTVAVEYMRCSLYQSSLNVDSVLQRMQGSVVLAMCQACQFIRNNCWNSILDASADPYLSMVYLLLPVVFTLDGYSLFQ